MGAPEVPQGTSGTKSPRALAISEKAFGPEHPETNRTRSNFAELFLARRMFVIRDGKKIAKRDQQAKAWIPLEPGWQVFDTAGGRAIEIVYRGTRVQ